MAVQAKDGSYHHSAGRASLHDDMMASSKKTQGGKPAGVKAPKPAGGEQGEKEGGTDVSHMDIGEVVSKHGPAHHIAMHHDHDGQMSTVTSHHGEEGKAHMHHSEHSGADHVEAAHEHASEAAGTGQDKEEEADNETPGDEQEQEMEQPMQGKGIPGMAAA